LLIAYRPQALARKPIKVLEQSISAAAQLQHMVCG
jgi:hypothetical protein